MGSARSGLGPRREAARQAAFAVPGSVCPDGALRLPRTCAAGSRRRTGDLRRLEERRLAKLRCDEVERRREKDIDRVAFFSDAVFAIAITLLVLRITMPPVGEDLGQALLERGTSFLMYAISFWVIGQYWLTHHRMFRYIRGYDTRLIVMNLFLMLCIAFLPYPTELLGRDSSETIAVVFYAAAVAVTGLASTSIWWYAGSRGYLDDELSARQIRRYTFIGLYTLAVFLVSIPLAFIDPGVAMWFWLAVALSHSVERLVARVAGNG